MFNAERIKELLVDSNLSAVGRAVGVSYPTMLKLKHGKGKVNQGIIKLVSRYFENKL